MRYTFFDAGDSEEPYEKPPLYVPTGWIPPMPEAYLERFAKFENLTSFQFRTTHKTLPNLTRMQQRAQDWLLQHPEVTVLNADKNLGPITMDRSDYLKYAYQDHLQDSTTYEELSTGDKNSRLNELQEAIDSFCIIWTQRNWLTEMDARWIRLNTSCEPSYFYLLPKIHKTPLKTRPIISYSGSVCSGIAKWLDVELKKILPHLPYIATSSKTVVQELRAQQFDPGTLLLTMDAVSMYTNIHLGHALPVFTHFFTVTEQGKEIIRKAGVSAYAIIHALDIVMKNNIFAFGDTFWLQKAGTAMGTPPAPSWATIYFCIWEITIIPEFEELTYYKRYIDDGFGCWTPYPGRDNIRRLAAFEKRMNSFGADHQFFASTDRPLSPLQWTFSDLSPSAIFLDLNLSISNGTISTTIYEKDLNLYLYIPPNSCHSKGVLKGLIYGMTYRAKHLNTNESDCIPFLVLCFNRLLARGYDHSQIKPIFCDAITDLFSSKCHATLPNLQLRSRPLFLHVPVNPADPPSSTFQQIFKRSLHSTCNADPNAPAVCTNLTVCYHGQRSLHSILSPRKGRFGPDFSIATALEAFRNP